jgi:hypothetical protein
MTETQNRYSQIIESVFSELFQEGFPKFLTREDIVQHAKKLDIKVSKKYRDILYSFRYRSNLPKSITEKAPEGYEWLSNPPGKVHINSFFRKRQINFPNPDLLKIKILDATPGIVNKYSLDDEQALFGQDSIQQID